MTIFEAMGITILAWIIVLIVLFIFILCGDYYCNNKSIKNGAFKDGSLNNTNHKGLIKHHKQFLIYEKYFLLGREHRNKIKELSELYNKDE